MAAAVYSRRRISNGQRAQKNFNVIIANPRALDYLKR